MFGSPMRPSWGNGGVALGNSVLSKEMGARHKNTTEIDTAKSRRIALVGLDGQLYQRSFSAHEWMHPDRFSWDVLGGPPAPEEGRTHR